MALTQITTDGIKDGTIASADLSDQSVTLAKLPHGTSSNDGKFLRANNGADPTFETVSSVGGSTGVDFNDNVKARFGTGHDLQIYHDGTDSYLQNTTGTLRINNDGTDLVISTDNNIHIRTNGTEEAVKAIANGAVELYYDNSKRFETRSGGAAVFGHLELGDNDKVMLGDSNDLQIYHDGNNSKITEGGTGILAIGGSQVNIESADHGEVLAKFIDDGAVELYYDNSKKFRTYTGGVIADDNLWVGTDNKKLLVGGSADLEIFHDGSNNQIKGVGGHPILFHTNNTQRAVLQTDGHFRPSSNNTYDLGTSSDRWRNIYTNDLNLSNEGGANDVDGTWGSYTIQEGAEDLFLVNKRSGKKYKFNLTEVS